MIYIIHVIVDIITELTGCERLTVWRTRVDVGGGLLRGGLLLAGCRCEVLGPAYDAIFVAIWGGTVLKNGSGSVVLKGRHLEIIMSASNLQHSKTTVSFSERGYILK